MENFYISMYFPLIHIMSRPAILIIEDIYCCISLFLNLPSTAISILSYQILIHNDLDRFECGLIFQAPLCWWLGGSHTECLVCNLSIHIYGDNWRFRWWLSQGMSKLQSICIYTYIYIYTYSDKEYPILHS